MVVIQPIIMRLVVSRVTCFQYEELDVLVLHMHKCAVIKVDVMYIKENYLIVDRVGALYTGYLGSGFKPFLSIHIPIWCVVECPALCDVEVEIL